MTRAHVTPFEFVARQAPRPQGLPDVNSAYLEQARGACRCGRPLLARARHAPWRHAPARGARRGRASRRLVAAWSLVRCSRGGPLRTRDAKQISVGQCGRKALVCAAARAWRCRSPHHIRVLVCFERREAPLLHHQVPFEVLLCEERRAVRRSGYVCTTAVSGGLGSRASPGSSIIWQRASAAADTLSIDLVTTPAPTHSSTPLLLSCASCSCPAFSRAARFESLILATRRRNRCRRHAFWIRLRHKTVRGKRWATALEMNARPMPAPNVPTSRHGSCGASPPSPPATC